MSQKINSTKKQQQQKKQKTIFEGGLKKRRLEIRPQRKHSEKYKDDTDHMELWKENGICKKKKRIKFSCSSAYLKYFLIK